MFMVIGERASVLTCSYFFALYFRMMPFFCIHISQGSVATRLGYGGLFVHDFITNFLLSLTVKEF